MRSTLIICLQMKRILRHGAGEAFDFLLRHWAQLQDDPQRWQSERNQVQRRRDRLRQEWKETTESVEWDVRAARELLEFLLPAVGDYLGERRGAAYSRIQGIAGERDIGVA